MANKKFLCMHPIEAIAILNGVIDASSQVGAYLLLVIENASPEDGRKSPNRSVRALVDKCGKLLQETSGVAAKVPKRGRFAVSDHVICGCFAETREALSAAQQLLAVCAENEEKIDVRVRLAIGSTVRAVFGLARLRRNGAVTIQNELWSELPPEQRDDLLTSGIQPPDEGAFAQSVDSEIETLPPIDAVALDAVGERLLACDVQ